MKQSVIRMMCPNLRCRRILAVPPSARGKTVRCGRCGTSAEVPNESTQRRSQPSTPASETH